MAGTKAGAAKAKATILAKDPEFFQRIGAAGGKGGYSMTAELVQSMPVDINPAYTILSDGTLLGKDGNAKKPQLDKKGYLRVQVYVNGKPVTEKAHRLVARHFIANPDNKPQVNHIDGDKTNNRVANLEWSTQAENMRHAVENNYFPKQDRAIALAPQVITAIEQRYLISDICRLNGFNTHTLYKYMEGAKAEPITTLKLGRRTQLYYFDKERQKYRVLKKDTGIETAQFDTEQEAIEYVDSLWSKGGFAADRELARRAGAKGGKISRRGSSEPVVIEPDERAFLASLRRKFGF